MKRRRRSKIERTYYTKKKGRIQIYVNPIIPLGSYEKENSLFLQGELSLACDKIKKKNGKPSAIFKKKYTTLIN